MENTWKFWHNWRWAYKFPFYIAFACLVLLGVVIVFAYFQDYSLLISWEKIGELESIKIPLSTLSKSFFDFTTDADSYLITERFVPGKLEIPFWFYEAYAAMLMLGLCFILVALPDLDIRGFGLVLALVFLTFSGFHTEGLEIASSFRLPFVEGKTFLLLLVTVFGVPAYYFKSFSPDSSYGVRFTVFGGLAVAVTVLAYSFSDKISPAFHVASYSTAMPIVFFVLFCIVNAHEMMRLFVWLTASNDQIGKNNTLRHLLILSAIYIINLIYAYAHFSEGIDWDLFYLHPFAFLAITSVTGIWGLAQREGKYASVFPFLPTGLFLYLGIALIGLSSAAFAVGTLNDPLIEVHEDTVLYFYLCMGAAFLAYLYSNYSDLFHADRAVYKVLFKHERINYWLMTLMGGLFVVMFLYKADFFPYDQSFSGHYNKLGDYFLRQGDRLAAKQYYKISTGFDPRNHRSYYSLGGMALEEKDEFVAFLFFQDALNKKKTPFTYAHLSNLQINDGKVFEPIFAYQEGIAACPESGELYNNLALQLAKVKSLDSALIMFEKAKQLSSDEGVVEANMFSIWTKSTSFSSLDSIYRGENPSEYIGLKSNELVFLNVNGQTSPRTFDPTMLPDTVLTTHQLCYLYNFALNSLQSPDTSITKLLGELGKVQANDAFDLYLKFAEALLLYQQSDFLRAMEVMKEVESMGGLTNPYFANLLGVWMLEHNQYQESADYFRRAYFRGQKDAQLNWAIALAELPNKSEALEVWGNIAKNNTDASVQSLANEMLYLLNPGSYEKILSSKNDLHAYRFAHFHLSSLSDEQFDALLASIVSAELGVMASTERANYYLAMTKTDWAGKYLKEAVRREISKRVEPLFQTTYLRYLHQQRKFDADFLDKAEHATYPREQTGMKAFYLAAYYGATGLALKSETMYKTALQQAPFETLVYTELALFYIKNNQYDSAYSVLLQGVKTNPHSIVLRKEYISICLRQRYFSFAEFELGELKNKLTPKEYDTYLLEYQQQRQAAENTALNW